MKIPVSDPVRVVRRAFYLAWKACGGTFGMGFLQNNPGADEDAVWDNVARRGDYYNMTAISGPGVKGTEDKGEAYGDYVFGRMMKLSVKWADGHIEVTDSAPRNDYQAWCNKYPTYAALIEAAIASLA